MTLATFYAAVAGGTGSILGLPHNAIAVSLAEQLANRTVTFFSWMAVGVPLVAALLVAFYMTIRLLVRVDLDRLPSSHELLASERARLGAMSTAESRTLLVFAIVVFLFTVPSLVGLVMGATHPTTERAGDILDTWVMPPIILFLLFLVPSGRGSGEAVLSWKEDHRQVPWDAMMLCAGAVAMVDALTRFGFVTYVEGLVAGLGLGRTALLYVAALVTAWSTDFMSGTAAMTLYGSIFIPAAQAAGHNPASMSVMIANVSLGLTFPWAGAAAATAFSVGDIDIKRMIAVGVPATIIFALVAATMHRLLGGLM
jgi:sodium-dependent dicarboxylate transporter 2/3/5